MTGIAGTDRDAAWYGAALDSARRLFARLVPADTNAELPPGEIEAIARDVGMSTGELHELIDRGPEAARLLYERLARLGIEPADIERLGLGMIRDLERTCSGCGAKGVCEHDMAERPGDDRWKQYCGNSETIDEILATKPAAAETPAGCGSATCCCKG